MNKKMAWLDKCDATTANLAAAVGGARLARRWTRATLARKAGVTERKVSNAEGNKPSVSADVLFWLLYVMGLLRRDVGEIVACGSPVEAHRISREAVEEAKKKA